jgi:hypothetical protein
VLVRRVEGLSVVTNIRDRHADVHELALRRHNLELVTQVTSLL